MIKAAVLGSPISHSLSPALHKRAYELLGVAGSYGAIDLIPELAGDFFSRALEEDWTGFSLTMPLKETIFELVSSLPFEIEPLAARMRSANTLLLRDGLYLASSTDRTGFMRLFEGVAKDRVAIIGGGGTARAALGALDGSATEIDFLLRSPHRRDALSRIAQRSAVNFFDMDHSLRGYDLVIATVPSGATDSIAADLDFQIPCFCEVLYKPFPTPLLAKAQSLGGRTLDGIDLLVEQAMDQVAIFSGQVFDFGTMRSALQAVGREHLR